jgi:benzoate/toluate 1,2-dioxygenase subunit beta
MKILFFFVLIFPTAYSLRPLAFLSPFRHFPPFILRIKEHFMPSDRHLIENFLYREARLMDSHAYDEWFALWTDDALYWIPSNDDEYDPQQHVSIVYENKARIEDRIFRLKSGAAYAQDPKSRVSRVISNVEIEAGENSEVTVYSTFNLTALRRSKMDTFAGRTTHKLRPDGESFKIAYKKVVLINNDEVINNMTFLV